MKSTDLYRERFKNREMPRKLLEFDSGAAGAETAQLQEVGRCRWDQIQRQADVGRTDFRITSGIYLIAGEMSGDVHGAHLIEELLRLEPQLNIAAVSGPRMRSQNIESRFAMEDLQVMGFIDVIAALPKIFKMFRAIKKDILQKQPQAVVCIDYPGFNLRLARSLRKSGFRGKLIHYICPTVWAYGKGRIALMAKNLDRLLCIFPFEPTCFKDTTLPVDYVGHPLVKKVKNHRSFEDFFNRYHLDPKKKILAIFPGSRKTEIDRNLSLQIESAQRLKISVPALEIAISLSHPQHREILLRSGLPLIEPEHRYDLMQNAYCAVATSGTVVLELALFQTPTVVNFAIRPIDVFLAQKIFRINLPHYAIVNILAGEMIFPELFGPHLTADSLTREIQKLWHTQRERSIQGCQKVIELLGSKDAIEEAAHMITQDLQ